MQKGGRVVEEEEEGGGRATVVKGAEGHEVYYFEGGEVGVGEGGGEAGG